MRHACILALALCGALAAAEVQQLPLSQQLDQDFGNYQHDQVWRLDWADLDRAAKDDILQAIELLELDVWKSTPSSLDVHLHPSSLPLLSRFIPSSTPFAPFITNLSALASVKAASSSLDGSWDLGSIESKFHDEYHTIEDIHSFGDALVAGFDGVNGLRVEGFSVGQTYEGREIRGWKAWTEQPAKAGSGGTRKGRKGGREGEEDDNGDTGGIEREFVVQSGQHAREWVGPATAMYWFHEVLLAATTEPNSHQAQLLKAFTFTVVPTINPDGYVYSQQHGRLWRKNRQDTGSKICQGIDLNSNWGYKWRKSRAAPCSDAYSGDAAFEAYETKAMGEYLSNTTSSQEGKRRKVRAFVDLHSYGQLFMFPFAYSCDEFPHDAEMLMEAGLGVAKAMRSTSGQGYQAGQACELTYRAPGDAIDFAYGTVDARWSYSAELRDTGTYGFLLPPSLIRPAAEEAAAGLLYLAKFIYTAEVEK